jgi:microsomal dipeptidase-like Zn-dependent dipeptidase
MICEAKGTAYMQSIFDGHNDTLLRLWQFDDHQGKRFLEGDDGGHIDLPRARQGGLSAAFFAIYPPASQGVSRRQERRCCM